MRPWLIKSKKINTSDQKQADNIVTQVHMSVLILFLQKLESEILT